MELLTAQVAEKLKVSELVVRKLVQYGWLRDLRADRGPKHEMRIPATDVMRLAKSEWWQSQRGRQRINYAHPVQAEPEQPHAGNGREPSIAMRSDAVGLLTAHAEHLAESLNAQLDRMERRLCEHIDRFEEFAKQWA